MYLALFPFGFSAGFSAGYLLGWRWPLFGGALSLACMGASLVAIGRTFGVGAYLICGVVSIPGVLYVAGRLLRRRARGE